jgi:NADPH:quinone reductase-like Zn-dependent oxidoreductase
MRAIVCEAYGPPEVLQLKEVAQPVPKENEVLIRVRAASAGPADSALRKGDPYLVRLVYGLKQPRLAIIGAELAGEIVAVGTAVTSFKPGDEVFAMSPNSLGAYAEYLALPADGLLALKSPRMSFEEAVGICEGGAIALTFLRDVGRVQPGQRVLINGASGAVGAYAVQLAKAFGAQVTAVCSTANLELVRSLGADVVIDYTREDFTQLGGSYDIIFDAVGKSSFARCKGALAPQGCYLTTVPNWANLRALLGTALSRGKRAKFATAGLMQSQANLRYLVELYEAGKLRAVIDRRYNLEEIVEAHRYVDGGHKKGNVVIVV